MIELIKVCSGKVAEAFWFWEELKVFKIKGTLLVECIGKKDEEKDSTSATKEMEQSGEEEHASASDLEKYTRRGMGLRSCLPLAEGDGSAEDWGRRGPLGPAPTSETGQRRRADSGSRRTSRST